MAHLYVESHVGGGWGDDCRLQAIQRGEWTGVVRVCAVCASGTRDSKHSPNLLLHLQTEGNVGEVEGREPAAVSAEHNPPFGVAATAAASERLFRHGVVLVIKS
jgi:hypothetical protein